MKSNKENHKPAKPLEKSANHFPVVGIGASAGGLDAFKKLLRAVPENSGMAFVLVQHLDPKHESLLPELLQKVTAIPVLEISDDLRVEPNHIYIIPSNKMMVANDGVLLLSPRTTNKNERNLPIDLFFASLAEVHQSHSIGVVLSGTATDGTKGLKAIKDHGGITFAQSEDSAAYDGMPHSAIQAGVVDFVLAPEQIPQKLLEITRITNGHGEVIDDQLEQEADVFRQMLSLLRIRKGTDFTYYKQSTIRRRILRRMALNKIEEPEVYLKFLRENKTEQDVLFQDLLIPVTSFFRDPKSFDHLCETAFPEIIKNKPDSEPIRVWVAGCSTGQEVYSIAICLKEFLGEQQQERVQIFATDISEPAIAKARQGIYLKTEMDGLSSQRLQEFFSKTNGTYQANKSIRDMCVFAVHNFLKDPPFGKIDLVSCRNVLIYMEPYLQKKALTTFHYALNSKAFLLLGKSETISHVPELFATAFKGDKLFSRKDVPGKYMLTATLRHERGMADVNISSKNEPDKSGRTDFQKTADDIMLSKYTPAGVVVNEDMDIVHFRGKTIRYLEQVSGTPSHNLLKMAKEGLAFELRNILHKAKKEKASVIKENIPVNIHGNLQTISIEALPLPDTIEPHYLVLFHEKSVDTSELAVGGKQSAKQKTDAKNLRIAQLEKELAQAREDMRGIPEDQEAANEELQSANEELLSSSEELQSLNEELETGKEELQSTNEELSMVNQELIGLNEQVTEVGKYSEGIISTIREPLVVLDKNLRIKSANGAFYKTFQVNEVETEGRLIYQLGDNQWNIPALRTLLEDILPKKTLFADFEVILNFPNIGERILLLNAREIIAGHNAEKLILLSIEDVTERIIAQRKLEESEKHFRLMANMMPAKISNANPDGDVTYFNKQWLGFSGYSFEELRDFGYYKMMHPDELEEFQTRLQNAAATGTVVEMEMRFKNKEGDYKWHLNLASPVMDETGKIKMWVGVTTEIQHQKEQREELENAVMERTKELSKANSDLQKMNQELESFTYISSHDLQEPLRKIQTFSNRLLEKEHQRLSDSGKDYLERMNKAAGRMQALLEDLLNYSHALMENENFEETDLNEILREVKEDLDETISEKDAMIEAHGLCKAPVNASQFRQVFHNLISNALKFSKPGVSPHIIIQCNVNGGSQLQNQNPALPASQLIAKKSYCHISFSDSGIGFEPEYQDKIFEVFQRLHGKQEYVGTGIGLAIVRKIISKHEGYITSIGELGKGARFDIYIPVNKPKNWPSELSESKPLNIKP